MKLEPSLLGAIVVGFLLAGLSPEKSGADEFYKGKTIPAFL
jgi:hypothetical protein